ncbi:cilia- and flagella-associated protein 251 isoform X2 [Manis pentadactyla]|uniref:cilia- and flagella-associated protein 251 isoform X2 n=1 Tax=Manis pentadactyla TaxID=143292 RepID=UPI00255C4F96|nr:cilia- and flagella-associated protein 251 isoform X2 [Manis pentadactyla]
MSDAEENPLEETEDEETEMEEEKNPDYKEAKNMQQESKEDDTLAWRESQEEGELWEGEVGDGVEEEEGEAEKEQEEGVEKEEEAEEEKEEEEWEEEEGEEGEKRETEEERQKEEEGEGEVEGEADVEEEEETVGGEMEEKPGASQEVVAAGIQEETTTEPQEITKSMISLERLTLTDSQAVLSGTIPKSHSDGKLKHSLPSKLSGTCELARDLSSQLAFLDLDQSSSEEPQISCSQRQSSGELEGKTDQLSQHELGQERRDSDSEKGERRQEKRISYLIEEKEEILQPKAGIPEDSLVSTSTEDILFQKDDSANVYPLTQTWSFGWNSSLPVYYIGDKNQRVLLYVCAHTAVIYNVFKNNQHHLQGHPNVISCFCVSEDRRWIATADKGPSCLIIIWDSFTGIPVHTIFDSCPEGNGIRAIAITHDAKYLATISDAEIQKVCIWRWTLAVETPACTLDLPKEYGFQNYLTFNPTNNKELVSNSKTQAIYYLWHEEEDILVYSAPLLTEKTFNKLVGKFSQSVFHLNLTQILSATMEGKLVVWDIYHPLSSASTSVCFPSIKPCKLVHLQEEGITVLTTVDRFIVTGDLKGNIKFYDHTLSIANWYSHFNLGSIRTLSFSKTPASPPTEKSNYPPDCTLKGDLFIVRNFIIGTSDATVYHLTTDGTKLEKIFVEPKDAICAISCHPYQPLIAIGSFCGMIKVWDYEKKEYLFSRVFEKGRGVQSLTYNPEGALLGAGFTEGTVYILDAMSLENEIPEPFKYSRTNVTHISFSHDSQYMATAIEYNLLKSCKDHLEVLDIHRTDQGSYPTCMVWYPPLTKELFLLVCNSGYKVKLFNSTTKMCRKTLLGPVYGSPIEQIHILPVKTTLELQKRHLVFINRDKVGLQILPVDGNPHKTSAIVCHPNGVAGMTLSYDGCYAFTAGGQDRTVVQWKINLSALEAAVSLGGEDLTPFYGLVSGGREGKFYRELEDYFYYSQLRSQGIDTMETRKVSEHIGLSELPFVMRATGFYPSEEEIDDMFNEIRYSEYVDTGKLIDKINLPDFLKVYLNHRPPFGNTMRGIQQSFDILGFTNSKGKKVIRREDFLKLLLTKGEHMTEEEMSDCFATLLGLNPEGWKSEPAASSVKGSEICFEEELPEEITAEIFTTDILGLTISQDFRQDPMVSEVVRNV